MRKHSKLCQSNEDKIYRKFDMYIAELLNYNHKFSRVVTKGHCRSQKRFENYKTTNYSKEGFLPIVLFMAFVLWNFDHRNFGLLFPKFLLYWAKWNV